MLGGINNGLFLHGFGGFAVVIGFIFFLKWAFPSKKDPLEKARRKELKKSLRSLKRK